MSTIINATTTNGVVIQPDNSGSLVLQTNNGTTALTIDTSQRAAFVAGTAAAPTITTTGDTNTGMFFPAADTIAFAEGGTEVMRLNSSGNVGIGTTSPTSQLHIYPSSASIWTEGLRVNREGQTGQYGIFNYSGGACNIVAVDSLFSAPAMRFLTSTNGSTETERMRIDSSGNVLVAKTSTSSAVVGINLEAAGAVVATRTGDLCYVANRLSNDGTLISFRQDSTEEGSISVSGTTVSYNGGHLSRWSQFDNETTKVEIYRGTVLESVDAMCVWEKDGQPLPNEQATKTIVSTTLASKAVAGVFDRYDEDDENNPYDFYVAQSGDFVIRIAQGVTVQNGDLLESAGDGTAKPQADDICRSSTIAKVTSNYVSATYEDGSYCVPCILMIG